MDWRGSRTPGGWEDPWGMGGALGGCTQGAPPCSLKYGTCSVFSHSRSRFCERPPFKISRIRIKTDASKFS